MEEQQGTSLAPPNYTQITVECKFGWLVRISQILAWHFRGLTMARKEV